MRKKHFENFPWPLWWGFVFLLVVGIANLYSALSVWGEGAKLNLFWNQVLWFGVGLFALLFFVSMDYRLWEKLGAFFYGFTLAILLLVLAVGKDVSGHRSWFQLGPVSLQPSEFAKLGLIFILAKFFSENLTPSGFTFRGLLKPLVFTLAPFVLVLLQKDLGTSLFYPLLFMTFVFVARIRKQAMALFLCLVALGGGLAYQYGLKPYQKTRLSIFLHPEKDPKRSGYHLMQSKIAVGSGKMLGKGYLKGEINKLKYLPDKHTDFIFPVMAEEWGFLGSLVTLALFAFLLWQGLTIASRAREPFGSFLALGVVAMFFWHLVINLGGVLGMIPLTGVPLPFMSYGGSSTLAFLIGVGLLFNVHIRRFMF